MDFGWLAAALAVGGQTNRIRKRDLREDYDDDNLSDSVTRDEYTKRASVDSRVCNK